MAHAEKIAIAQKLAGSRTAHLEPIIEYLRSCGNRPAYVDGYQYNRDGFGVYEFEYPLDIAGIAERFELPLSLRLNRDSINDTRNFVAIAQHVAS